MAIAVLCLHGGKRVYYLFNDNRVQPATTTEAERMRADGALIYPSLRWGNSQNLERRIINEDD